MKVFRARADPTGAMTFAQFMALALYDPGVGYYRRARARIGYGRGTDFFTATTSGAIFGELVAAACATLLRANRREPGDFTFVELGAENDRGVLAGVEHPFAATRTIAIGESIAIAGECVVFSNELFDAQPCARFVFRCGRWREIGVRLEGDALVEIELPGDAAWPPPDSEGYHFDWPDAATALAGKLAREPWSGLFVAIDYGKSAEELARHTPQGTVRAYYRHTQSNDLLARAGEQDLTCHVCWTWIEAALRKAGFASPTLESQEAFFIRHAADFIARASAAEATRLSRRKLALMQLLHPAHLGQKFQVLHALRAQTRKG